jgi:hypothetical protein
LYSRTTAVYVVLIWILSTDQLMICASRSWTVTKEWRNLLLHSAYRCSVSTERERPFKSSPGWTLAPKAFVSFGNSQLLTTWRCAPSTSLKHFTNPSFTSRNTNYFRILRASKYISILRRTPTSALSDSIQILVYIKITPQRHSSIPNKDLHFYSFGSAFMIKKMQTILTFEVHELCQLNDDESLFGVAPDTTHRWLQTDFSFKLCRNHDFGW